VHFGAPVGAARWAQGAGEDALERAGLVPADRDALNCAAFGKELPVILPEGLHAWSPEQIEDALAAYTGYAPDELTTHLRPDNLSTAGFLAQDERLGEVIARDAATLTRHGVHHAALGARLERIIALLDYQSHAALLRQAVRGEGPWSGLVETRRPGGAVMALRRMLLAARWLRRRVGRIVTADELARLPWEASKCVFAMGRQEDPLTVFDLYPWTGLGAGSLVIRHRPTGREVSVHDLTASLIRRACFFEGRVPCRVDPESALFVAGMLPETHWDPRSLGLAQER
jgi:hypothetical protein